MKVLAILFLVALTSSDPTYRHYTIENAAEYFEEFITTYNKHYANKAEKDERFKIFKQNLELIIQNNANSEDHVYDITKFSDLTNEEFIKRYTGLRTDLRQEATTCHMRPVNATSAPDSWSWKDKNVITKPKDQGMCGSCWAFGAIGNIEARYAMKHKELLDLSEQQLVDCDNINAKGCGGASLESPFQYLMKNSGSMQEKDYPYEARQNKCSFDASKVKAKVTDCITYHGNDEEQLKNLLYSSGPLTIGVDAFAWQAYTRNILTKCPGDEINHSVLLVGYGTDHGKDYWLIKNSWGESWGEEGFIRIQRGINACGIINPLNWIEAVVE